MACYHTMNMWEKIPVPSTQVSIYKKSVKTALKANSQKQNRKVDEYQGLGEVAIGRCWSRVTRFQLCKMDQFWRTGVPQCD